MLPSGNQTWQWKIPPMNGGFIRKITDNCCIFHCHVWLPEGKSCILKHISWCYALMRGSLSYPRYLVTRLLLDAYIDMQDWCFPWSIKGRLFHTSLHFCQGTPDFDLGLGMSWSSIQFPLDAHPQLMALKLKQSDIGYTSKVIQLVSPLMWTKPCSVSIPENSSCHSLILNQRLEDYRPNHQSGDDIRVQTDTFICYFIGTANVQRHRKEHSWWFWLNDFRHGDGQTILKRNHVGGYQIHYVLLIVT